MTAVQSVLQVYPPCSPSVLFKKVTKHIEA